MNEKRRGEIRGVFFWREGGASEITERQAKPLLWLTRLKSPGYPLRVQADPTASAMD